MKAFTAKLGSVLLFFLVAGFLVLSACEIPTETTTSGGGGGGGSTQSCNTGWCLNNGQCCQKGHQYYTYGGHGYAAGCYASCPYVGECGSRTQCW